MPRHYRFVVRVRAAFFATADRSARVRFCAAVRACRESAFLAAALRPSRFNAPVTARERFRDGFLAHRCAPFEMSR
jgi:hypothetical protein